MTPEARIALLVAVGLFLAFLVLKSRISFGPRAAGASAARKQLAEAKARALSAANDGTARGAAWRDAAAVAMDQLGRPMLAAGFALRAHRADPDNADSVVILARSLTGARRLRTLEKVLWQRLGGTPGAAYEAAFTALVEAYEGPMRRPLWASALRSLRAPR